MKPGGRFRPLQALRNAPACSAEDSTLQRIAGSHGLLHGRQGLIGASWRLEPGCANGVNVSGERRGWARGKGRLGERLAGWKRDAG